MEGTRRWMSWVVPAEILARGDDNVLRLLCVLAVLGVFLEGRDDQLGQLRHAHVVPGLPMLKIWREALPSLFSMIRMSASTPSSM